MATLPPERIDVKAFGEFLRDARERRGLTIQQIASETRIPWRHLEALEHGNLDAVPGGVYRRAEIRAYADAVGLDRTLALTQFDHAVESSSQQPHAAVEAPPSNSGMRMSWTALGAVGVVAAATMFAVSLRGGDRTDTPAAPAVSPERATPQAAPAASSTPKRPEEVTAPAAAPTATDAPGVLTITSSPPGARVMVDGIGRGATPLTVLHLTGAIRIRVIKDGYVSQERDVRINGRPIRLHVALNAVH